MPLSEERVENPRLTVHWIGRAELRNAARSPAHCLIAPISCRISKIKVCGVDAAGDVAAVKNMHSFLDLANPMGIRQPMCFISPSYVIDGSGYDPVAVFIDST